MVAERWAPRTFGSRSTWPGVQRQDIVLTDGVAVLVAVFFAPHLAGPDRHFGLAFDTTTGSLQWLTAILLAGFWLGTLAVEGVWRRLAPGNLPAEARRILLASLVVFSVVGMVGYLTLADVARDYLLISGPVGTVSLLVSHWWWSRTAERSTTVRR